MPHHDDAKPIPVHFPLLGEWFAVSSPGDKIPSHGIDQFGQRYAYDFMHSSDLELARGWSTGLRYWLGGGIRLERSQGMHAPILAPIDGRVIAAKDGWPERRKATPIDFLAALTAGFRLSETKIRADYRVIAGNYLIIEARDGFAFLAHATTGSISVEEGARVKAGQVVARVGDTGNSTAPHLHYHLMDGPDLWTAAGLPSCFIAYDQLENGVWRRVTDGVPRSADRLLGTVAAS
jgi:murein DD-endopeptidase MepM/ murein hydrolase activator NlpD